MRRRHLLPLPLFTIAAALATSPADARYDPNLDPFPDLDFEQNLRGWSSQGSPPMFTAFAAPVLGDVVTVSQLFQLPVGGDYWHKLTYSLGHHGDHWLSSCWRRPTARDPHNRDRNCDAALGAIVSKEFAISANMTHFSALIGGSNNPHRVRVELQIKTENAQQADAIKSIRAQMGTIAAQYPMPTDGAHDEYIVVAAGTGSGVEDLRPFSVAIPPSLLGKTARIRIIDVSASDHINVDDIRFSAARWGDHVWGFADFHTHPMAHIGFGGLKGIRTLWGVPGNRWDQYGDPNAIRRDIPMCNPHHFGGRVAPWFLNGLENNLAEFNLFKMVQRDHDHPGGDPTGQLDFWAFPNFDRGAHEQYHITQIRRAYDGGLRLMSALVINSEIAEYLMSRTVDVPNDKYAPTTIKLTPERDVLLAAVNATKQLVAINGDWMEIAYTPQDARRIIRLGKLAVILGTELDHTGSLWAGKSPAEEVQALFDMGIRQITPVHAINTNLGSAALFQDGYNTGNFMANAHWFKVKDDTSCTKKKTPECVLFHFKKTQDSLIIGDSGAVMMGDADHERHPWHEEQDVDAYTLPPSDIRPGVTNTDGLRQDGNDYLNAAMRHGMLIDISHMSDVSAGQAIERAQHPEKHRDMQAVLHPYPLMISHAGFREQMFRGDYTASRDDLKGMCTPTGDPGTGVDPNCTDIVKKWAALPANNKGPGTVNVGFLPSEFDVPISQATAVAALGGVVGPFVAQEPIDSDTTLNGTAFNLPFTNDCAMTSKGFGAAYQYARKMGFSSVGIATDFGMHMTTAPRFGDHSCGAWMKAGAKDRPGFFVLERALNQAQYRAGDQKDGVVYADVPRSNKVRYGNNAPLKAYKMGTRSFDFNVDGMANYGLVPDMLQDLHNVSQGRLDLNPFFGSADGYIQMWEKAWAATACRPGNATCDAQGSPVQGCTAQDDSVCRGLGPDSFNHGAPLPVAKGASASTGATTGRCSQTSLWIEAVPVLGSNELREGDWALLQVANPRFAWHCGNLENEDWTDCDPGTSYVRVERSSSQNAVKGQAIHVTCLAAPLGVGAPPVPLAYITTMKERCGKKTLRVHSGDTLDNSPGRLEDTNQVAVRKVTGTKFVTYCQNDNGGADEIDTALPAGTNLVKVRRLDIQSNHPGIADRRYVIECYHAR